MNRYLTVNNMRRLVKGMLLVAAFCLSTPMWADIVIGGNVYGGGKQGAVGTAQSVAANVKAGTPDDSDNATTATIVTINGGTLNNVYGGGEMGDSKGQTNVVLKGGSISGSVYGGARMADIDGFTHVLIDGEHAVNDLVVKDVFGGNDVSGEVEKSALVESTEGQAKKIYVTNLFGGGNGDYDYASNKVDGEEQNPYAGKSAPDIKAVEIKLRSGSYSQVFGGGNMATVTETTDILLNNASAAIDESGKAATYQFDRVFGGNNKVAMAIRPTWHLEKASINNLYSGGNAGDMTHPNGILLAVTGENMTINNVYGGCRMANVNPAKNAITSETIEGVAFPSGFAARTLITNGKINNVYGGNDISGNVYGGCALEIQSSIINDVYGGGNGSYAYSNKSEWQSANPTESDYFYTRSLYDHRPNAESVYLRVAGTQAKPTYIGGSLYCGGNSATLTGTTDHSAQLKIGSYVIADNVFLGSNGANMVTTEMLAAMNERNTFDLTNSADFEEYMRGVEVGIKPVVSFDSDYETYSTKFGSLYCGGNVGSMSAEGQFTINFLNTLVIYDKIVGGCNNANVAKTTNNAYHQGGLITAMDDDNPKVTLNISGVKLEPRKLVKTTNAETGVTTFSLAWNKDANDATILKGGNVYGGCYASGYVNGKVQINVTADAISENVFKTTGEDLSGASYDAMRDYPLASTLSVYGGGYGKETEIWGAVDVNVTNNARILKVYGGGEMGVVGKLERNADGVIATQSVKYDGTNSINVEKFTTNYNSTVTLNATKPSTVTVLNAAKLYAGGFQGTVSGNTILNLNQGRIYDGFGGASNAEILGVAHTYVGKASAPEVAHNVYGANDFGGQILGTKLFEVNNSNDLMEKIVAQAYVEYAAGKITGDLFGGPCGAYDYSATKYATAINATGFTKPQLLTALTVPSGADYAANSFVNVISTSTSVNDQIAGRMDGSERIGGIFGAGEGMKGKMGQADEASSYVRLASATVQQRGTNLAPNVYGAGYCSLTENSLVDAFSGNYGTLFGGCYGVKYQERIDNKSTWSNELTYMGSNSEVHLYTMSNQNMDIYGAGANSGSKESGVVLYGGQARDVYGASFNEGITYAATVDVPSTSTSKVNTIFGGAKGKADEYACDVYNAFIDYNGANARVKDAIYGGNNAYRMMRNTYMFVHVPVLDFDDKLTDIFGGGLGENTVTLYTEVNMEDGAQVANVYGGGKKGQVLDTPSFRHYMQHGEPCAEGHGGKVYIDNTETYGYQRYLADYEVISFHDWIDAREWIDDENPSGKKDQNGASIGKYRPEGFSIDMPLYRLSTQQSGIKNTNVYIERGAVVAENAYGGGLGEEALVSGATGINLHGGTVRGDMYGGGNAGPVKEYEGVVKADANERHYASTNVYLGGGTVRNIYGGGLGNSADVTGSTNVTMGVKDTGKNLYTVEHNERDYATLYAGDATVERSLYGGGQQGAVFGTANVTINQGHVGYIYRGGEYKENLDLTDTDDNLLAENGNAFGAGYGEGATVDVTNVNIYGGTIRNSLYGGGEIAAVGQATMAQTGAHPKLNTISVPGRTQIYMYNGLVQGDVFGGGRGYSYDLTGNEVIGKEIYTDGYVFGSTDVNIRGGVIGTDKTLKEGKGNVFGGGNIGYCFTDAVKDGVKGDHSGEGRYYTNVFTCVKCHAEIHSHSAPTICPVCDRTTTDSDEAFNTTFTAGATNVLSEDCRVVVSPWAQAKNEITIDGVKYAAGDYIPTDALNKLKDKNTDKAQWDKVSQDGVIIRNAVFAGGNVSAGSDKVYANAVTVFGNATATINDIFFRDLITLGTDNIGGLYGDGNLTFVDGYRELNLTNYGTDYYGQDDNISYEKYQELNDRERAYFELQYQTETGHTYDYYTCTTAGTYGGVEYEKGKQISKTTYNSLTAEEKANFTDGSINYGEKTKISEAVWALMSTEEQEKWTIYGFCSIYAGRMMNTIQRADFCGVFGSRLVLQGAQDRVPEVVDYTRYTINRVGELSLNKATIGGVSHGNYFGMYNVVNYLGALTSDVKFDDIRTTDNSDAGYAADGTTTFYQWKEANKGNKKRNNGTSHNMVALASGVYLEIVQEEGSTPENKNYGLITGVVQLDLINVMQGLGGGYVYARNEHGARSGNNGVHQNLSKYNQNAVNNSLYKYNENDRKQIETSGNFIHNVKQIVDDCFPGGGRYDDYDVSPAHYWYIRGEMYVYDQYISAYTGSSNAYLENIDLPLSITAGSHGKLDLLDIKPNYYAYYFDEARTEILGENGNDMVVVNNLTYALNDIITYWDYMQLSDSQKKHFVDKTYVFTSDYSLTENGTVVPKGAVLLPNERDAFVQQHAEVWDPVQEKMVSANEVLHISNSVSHENGYVLTVDLTNPEVWDSWYSPETGSGKKTLSEYNALQDKTGYQSGPTYYTKQAGVYGQRYYQTDDIVTETVKAGYDAIPQNYKSGLTNQAVISPAYVSITSTEYDITVDGNSVHKTIQEGVGISSDEYAQLDAANKAKFAPAYTCTTTFEEDKDQNKYIYYAELITDTRYNELKTALVNKYKTELSLSDSEANAMAEQEMKDHFDRAHIVTTHGNYGGRYFEADKNYRALDTWASLSATDREKFNFRYDALDAILLSNYPGTGKEGGMTAYDGPYWDPQSGWNKERVYGAKQAIDYNAKYEGSEALKYKDKSGTEQTVEVDSVLSREQYESLPNEQHHYTSFKVDNSQVHKEIYIVKSTFVSGGTTYAAGKVIEASVFTSLDAERQANIQKFTPSTEGTYYICRAEYTINENGEGASVTDVKNSTKYESGTVPLGVIINKENYDQLPNRQKGFVVHGSSPIETSTLYVSSESDIFDLSKDRVITVIYQYKYEESDETGQNIEEISERHIINIHIEFKSGVPTVGQLQEPSIVLPGETVGLKLPTVTEGAYTILGGGWELYTNPEDANKHQNGVEYINNATKMYWYEDGYYVAYYTKTYLGKTYSNAVQFKVANYHDIAEVMADANYMYIDNPDVKRDSKIYIDNSTSGEIDLLYDLFQKSLVTSKKTVYVDQQVKDDSGHDLYYKVDGNGYRTDETTTDITAFPVTKKVPQQVPVFDDHARNAANLEFYLSDNVATQKNTWTSIGGDMIGEVAQCFSGNLNGNGYTVSGLDKSLFGSLCGNVYNLGVTGSFAGSGVADAGDGWVENCWIYTTNTSAKSVIPVFGTASTTEGEGRCIHSYNNYYPEENNYSFTLADGQSTGSKAMPLQAFNNGEVAYNLNGFYLAKRYADNTSSIRTNPYKYLVLDAEGNVNTDIKTGYYDKGAYYGTAEAPLGYVENLYYDGDYIYKDGIIPENVNERKKGTVHLPIWPDDYVFFGQMLTYGYDETNNQYQDMPSVINKADNKTTNRTDRIVMGEDGSNRVFRVPAYYRNSTMSDAHHNVNAYFVAKTKDGSKDIHEGMTAIDFTGKNDVENGYKNGWNNDDMFYAPVLDNSYAKLLGFNTEGLTQNLLVYVDDNDVANATSKMYVVKEALDGDIDYQEGNPETYRTVAAASESEIVGVKGHLVTKTDAGYVAQNDHFLVDKQEFNAPIEYQFADNKRMWYQRTPDRYVNDQTKGWEGISLPFSAELVTTQDKGEITHFYGERVDGNDGHEYWLREYAGASSSTENSVTTFTVNMNRPAKDTSADAKTKSFKNIFLWDYYYNGNTSAGDSYDDNTDQYQQNYYSEGHDYSGYAYMKPGTPYIVGFPGERYYEFDLSGEFDAKTPGNTSTTPAKLAAQTITFASFPKATISVSDNEIADAESEVNDVSNSEKSGYAFKPNYLKLTVPVSTDADAYYVLDSEGHSFVKTTEQKTVEPFRTYFAKAEVRPSAPVHGATKSVASALIIGNSDVDSDDPQAEKESKVNIWSENSNIWIENNTENTVTMTVYTSGGQAVKKVRVKPMGKEFIPVQGRGIYMVGKTKVVVR